MSVEITTTKTTTTTAARPGEARFSRRSFVAGSAAALALPLVGAPRRAASRAAVQAKPLRIGFQKGSANLLVLKNRGDLETRLGAIGYEVSWAEFPAGPPLLEAMNAGSIDFGTTGAPPPIFAQAGGNTLVYASATVPSPFEEAILVPRDSPIQAVTDLKGTRVAATKGSSAHAHLVYALRTAGLSWEDVEPVYLSPADAKAAFEGGDVDAWSIWDPYTAVSEDDAGARSISNGESAKHVNRSFYLASRAFATEQGAAVEELIAALTETDAWADQNAAEVARLVSAETGIPEPTLLKVEERSAYGLEPVTPQIVEEQQALADLFHELGLIPERINVGDAVLGQETAGRQ